MSLSGTLNMISGPMYSGKTTELLRRLFVEAEAGMNVLYVNHRSDNRSDGPFSTHNPLYKERLSIQSLVTFSSIENLSEIDSERYDVIGIDEAQFFEDLYEQVKILIEEKDKYVVVAGLNSDFKRKPFGQLLLLEPLSDTYEKLAGHCKICARQKKRSPALFTKKIAGDDNVIIEVGGNDKYIPVCRKCFLEGN